MACRRQAGISEQRTEGQYCVEDNSLKQPYVWRTGQQAMCVKDGTKSHVCGGQVAAMCGGQDNKPCV